MLHVCSKTYMKYSSGVVAAKVKSGPSNLEFIILVSLMMSLLAFTIDAMLPALPLIGSDLGVQNPNSRQLVISIIFFGIAFGQIFFGPLSDWTGRKPAIYAGYALFIAGSLLSILATSFSIMLFGRLLQGLGAAAPRAVTLALVRDRFGGRAMAQIMSYIITTIVLVPMLAPSLGQVIMNYSGWRAIFGSFVLFALITLTWFALRIPETLDLENRAPFSLQRIVSATAEILKIRPALGYTVSAGLISGAFIGYLNSSQQILQEQFALGDLFPLAFAVIAFSIGIATISNSRLVIRYGMRFLVRWSLNGILALALAALLLAFLFAGQPPFWLFMAYIMLTFFCIGILFGNQNALAMEPLGHMAGIGAAIVGSLSTLISTPLGIIIGQSYNGTVLPLIIGMTVLTGLAILVVRWAEPE
jgi:DHA1 family bicyclomycin/chloramphenicol resistance-like MFS transporter